VKSADNAGLLDNSPAEVRRCDFAAGIGVLINNAGLAIVKHVELNRAVYSFSLASIRRSGINHMSATKT
jgi:hypothetical protein